MSIIVINLKVLSSFDRMTDKFDKNNSGRLTVNKLKYDEKSQLKTRIAILESQLNVANRETKFLKLSMNKPSKYFKKEN